MSSQGTIVLWDSKPGFVLSLFLNFFPQNQGFCSYIKLFFLKKRVMIFSNFFCICACYSTFHFACNGLMIPNWRAILTSHGNIPHFSWVDTSIPIHVLHFSQIKDLGTFLTEMSIGWNLLVKLCGTIRTSQKFCEL